MDIKQILLNKIEEKYDELGFATNDKSCMFWKIRTFEGNAVGQVGENFVKEIFKTFNLPIDKENRNIIHDEYDIKSNSKKIEIKTARIGIKNKTFQFNGINPNYNHELIIFIGITLSDIYFRIADGASIYDHKKRKHFLDIGNGELRQLVSMNPGNMVNLKLTLPSKLMYPIDCFVDDLKQKLGLS